MIKITKKDQNFDAIRWTLKAACKNPEVIYKEKLTRLNVREGKIEATDGHRAHVANFAHTYEPGVYDIIKNTQAEIVLELNDTDPFPDLEKVWPDVQKFVLCPHCPTEKKNFSALAKIIRAIPENAGLNADYLHDTIGSDKWSYAVPDDRAKPISLKNETRQALIMLTRME